MRKIKLTRANKSILLKALAPYYYRERALGHSTQESGRLILKSIISQLIKSRFFHRRNLPYANRHKSTEERMAIKRAVH